MYVCSHHHSPGTTRQPRPDFHMVNQDLHPLLLYCPRFAVSFIALI